MTISSSLNRVEALHHHQVMPDTHANRLEEEAGIVHERRSSNGSKDKEARLLSPESEPNQDQAPSRSASAERLNPGKLTKVEAKQRERIYRRSCCECLLLAPLFSVYMVLQWSHLSLAPSYRIESVLQFEFMKKRFGNYSYTVVNVHDAALFWEWFEVMMSQTVVVQEDKLGHPLPQEEWGYLNGFNKIIGGVRIFQDRGHEKPCEGTSGELCYDWETDIEDFGYPPCAPGEYVEGGCYKPELYRGSVNIDANEAFRIDNYTGHFEMWLDTLEPWSSLEKRYKYLEDRHWIDKQTRHIVVEMLLRNEQYEPLLSEVIFDFRFDRTGYIQEKAVIETFPADPYAADTALKLVLSSLFIGINAFLLYLFLRDYWDKYLTVGHHCVACQLTIKKHVIEVLSILATTAQVILWCSYFPRALDLLNRINRLQRPEGKDTHTGADAKLWDDYHHKLDDIELDAHEAVSLLRWLRELSALTLLCILLRHFKAWEGIPAFAAVTRTLSLSAFRLCAVLISGCTLVALFAGAAMLNYGSQLEEFHSVSRALQETAVIAMTGDPSAYNEMALIDPIFATAWFWSLISVMFMVVLNMILGILVDAASTASQEAPLSLQEQLTFTIKSYGDDVKHSVHYAVETMHHDLENNVANGSEARTEDFGDGSVRMPPQERINVNSSGTSPGHARLGRTVQSETSA